MLGLPIAGLVCFPRVRHILNVVLTVAVIRFENCPALPVAWRRPVAIAGVSHIAFLVVTHRNISHRRYRVWWQAAGYPPTLGYPLGPAEKKSPNK